MGVKQDRPQPDLIARLEHLWFCDREPVDGEAVPERERLDLPIVVIPRANDRVAKADMTPLVLAQSAQVPVEGLGGVPVRRPREVLLARKRAPDHGSAPFFEFVTRATDTTLAL